MNCTIRTIRTMRRDEVDLAIEWAAAEGWNPGLHDAHCFHAADPGGFLIAECEGQAVGCISAVSYGGRFGFIGLFIVLPAWRGRGVGSRLWAAGMARLAGQVVGLDGVPAQQAYYARNGFVLAWQNARFAGVARPAAGPDPAPVVPLSSVARDDLLADDGRVFPAPREAFLDAWTTVPRSTGLAWVEQGRQVGWGLIRRCRTGHKIAPLVAQRPEVALGLYDALCARVPAGDTVFLDAPLPNEQAVQLAQARGLEIVFRTARMYAGPPPVVALDRVYSVASFELG